MNLAMTLRAKGRRGVSERVGTIIARFGVTTARSEGYFGRYLAITRRHGGRPTLPITASVLARHPALIRRFASEGIEFAIHGHHHNDHRPLGLAEQERSIAKAAQVFQRAGVPVSGFRAPYLRYNAATHTAIRRLGLRYHSSQAVMFDVVGPLLTGAGERDGLARALRFYGAWDADAVPVRPRHRDGLIDIPVTLPDDEILIDRLHCTPAQARAVWLTVLDQTNERRELFTIQLHPERVDACGGALDAVLTAAQRRGDVWFATLGEIAEWWRRRAGASVTVEPAGAGRWLTRLVADPDVTLLRQEAAGAVHCIDGDALLDSARKPVVALSLGSSAAAEALLRDEGIIFERSDDATGYSASLDLPAEQIDEASTLRSLERPAGPLLRLNRWPQGARSAVAATGDIDSITIQDFAFRLWETRGGGAQ